MTRQVHNQLTPPRWAAGRPGLLRAGGALLLGVLLLLLAGCPGSKALPKHLGPVAKTPAGQPAAPAPPSMRKFANRVLADSNEFWTAAFKKAGKTYKEPGSVLFDDYLEGACAYEGYVGGPFYCSGDQQVYLDVPWLKELRTRSGDVGDFAAAYAIAHAVGHHLEYILGRTAASLRQAERYSEPERRELLLRAELQADFYAGMWARSAQARFPAIKPENIEAALTAASALGAERSAADYEGPRIVEPLTHGTDEQRLRWFKRGFETDDMSKGDTFSARQL